MKDILHDLCHLHYFTYLHFGSDKGHIDTDLPGLSIASVNCWQQNNVIEANAVSPGRRQCVLLFSTRSFPGKHTAKTQACSCDRMGNRAIRRGNN